MNKASSLVPVRGDSPVMGLPHLRDSMADLQQAGTDNSDATLPRAVSDNSIYGIDVSRDEEKVIVDALARHVVYSKAFYLSILCLYM